MADPWQGRAGSAATGAGSRAGICGAGTRKRASTRKGNVHLRTALVEAAVAASRKKDSYLRDKFHRLRARRDARRAAMAIGHKILIAAYHMLATGVPYRDLGAAYLDQVDKRRVSRNLVRRLQRLGYDVTIQPKAA